MKKLLLLMMSVAALTLNAQVYTEYFDGNTTDGTPTEAGDAIEDNYNGWYLCLKTDDQQVGANGEASPLIGSGDALFYGDYAGSEKGKVVELDSAVGYVTKQRTTTWVVTDDVDTLKMPGADGAIYAAFLFRPIAPCYNGLRDFFTYEFSATSNSNRGRAFLNYFDNGDVQFGVSRNKTAVVDGLDTATTIVGGIGQTYLLVMKYEVGDPLVLQDDTVKLFINPDPTKTEAEHVYLSSKDPQDDRTEGDIIRINLRQRGINAEIGGIRLGTDWHDVLQGFAVTGVSLDQATLTLDAGTTGTLVATVTPADAADPSVAWSSSNAAVATVANGVVTGVAAGEANIIVTTTDGAFKDTCIVTVNTPSAVNYTSISAFDIYPNPSNGTFTIANQAGANVTIYNVTGEVVYQISNIKNKELIFTQLAKGMYFVSVVSENTQKVSKIIVK